MKVNLAELRRSAGIASQEELAARAGVKQSAISKWETGRAKPALKNMLRLAVGLQQPLDVFVVGMDQDYDQFLERCQQKADEEEKNRQGAVDLSLQLRDSIGHDTNRTSSNEGGDHAPTLPFPVEIFVTELQRTRDLLDATLKQATAVLAVASDLAGKLGADVTKGRQKTHASRHEKSQRPPRRRTNR